MVPVASLGSLSLSDNRALSREFSGIDLKRAICMAVGGVNVNGFYLNAELPRLPTQNLNASVKLDLIFGR